MKITILGCGTSTGVPVPACQCSVCLSADPINSRLRASILIQTAAHNILIDTSPDLRQQALRADLRRVDAVLFTHAHADHILGMDDLRSFNFVQKSAIPCFALAETRKSIEEIFSYIFKPDPEYIGGGLAKLKFETLLEYQKFVISSNDQFTEIQNFMLLHGKTKVAGYRIGNFAYATDCNQIEEASYQYLSGLDVLILDGLRYEPHPTHFTIPEAIEISRRVKAKRTILTHYTHNVDYLKVNPELPAGVELAYDQMQIEL